MSQEGSQFIYRVVSQAELSDLKAIGEFRMGPYPTYERGKLFAIDYTAAARFKEMLYKLDRKPNTTIVTAQVSPTVYQRGDQLYTDGFDSILILAADLPRLIYVN